MGIVYIFVDESGDLGFTEESSKSFVVSYVIIYDASIHFFRHKVTKLLKRINLKQRERSKISEFKFSNNTEKTKSKFLELIKTLDLLSGTVVIKKNSVVEHLKDKPEIIYNYLTTRYILPKVVDMFWNKAHVYNHLYFTIDRSMYKSDANQYVQYLERIVKNLKYERDLDIHSLVKVVHEDSRKEPCLQIADYIAGTIFAINERGNYEYFKIIKDRIKFGDKWEWSEER